MLPDSIAHFFWALFFISLGVFVLIPALVGYWRLAHGLLVPTREGFVRLRDIPIMIVALGLTNVFYYKVGSGSLHPLPHDTLSFLLAMLDLLFVVFWLDTVVVSLITRRAKRAMVAADSSLLQARTDETTDRIDPKALDISPTDSGQTDENQTV